MDWIGPILGFIGLIYGMYKAGMLEWYFYLMEEWDPNPSHPGLATGGITVGNGATVTFGSGVDPLAGILGGLGGYGSICRQMDQAALQAKWTATEMALETAQRRQQINLGTAGLAQISPFETPTKGIYISRPL